jgi:hypothetical protein
MRQGLQCGGVAAPTVAVSVRTAVEASAVLDFDEFKECVARVGTAKYSAVKAMTPAMATRAMIQNMIGERDELTVLREDTYIRAERFDWKHESKALPGMSTDVHQRFMEDFGKIQLDGLYGSLDEAWQDAVAWLESQGAGADSCWIGMEVSTNSGDWRTIRLPDLLLCPLPNTEISAAI